MTALALEAPRTFRLWRCQHGDHTTCARGSSANAVCGCPCHWVTVEATREALGLPPLEECAHDH